jgi:high-affinity iron transporter
VPGITLALFIERSYVAGAFIIVLREIIEAGLIIGIVLAATHSLPSRGLYVAAGAGAGLLGAGLVAGFARSVSNALAGSGQEVFNAAVLALAAGMLAWHNVWMARHGREISNEMRRLGQEVKSGSRSLFALAIVVAAAVSREGAEVALFLYGLAVSTQEPQLSLLAGGFLGLLCGAAVSLLTYRGLVILPPRAVFKVTAVLLAFMAAGMAAQCAAFLEQADIATRLGAVVWNTSRLLPDASLPGRVLHTLLGYTGQPTQLQLLVYVATLGVIFGLMKAVAPPHAGGGRKLAAH